MRFWEWVPKRPDDALVTVTEYATKTGRSRRAARRKMAQYVRQGSLVVFR
jgi:hypothetical protein